MINLSGYGTTNLSNLKFYLYHNSCMSHPENNHKLNNIFSPFFFFFRKIHDFLSKAIDKHFEIHILFFGLYDVRYMYDT